LLTNTLSLRLLVQLVSTDGKKGIVDQGFELWQAGTKSFKAKDFEAAEDHLVAAYQAYTSQHAKCPLNVMDPRWGVCCTLAKVYRSTGRYEDAIKVLEKSAPFHAAFRELVGIFRFLGKAAKKDGDHVAHMEFYRKMYCLAKLNAAVMAMRLPDTPVSVDWQRAIKWLDEIRRQHGTMYCYQWDGMPISGDTILSSADYKALGNS
jgi:tetratricopeptide (TPR) repeat protein